MRPTIPVSLGLLLALFATSGQAEIYKSEGADGQTVFSDVPSSDAKEIEVPRTNTAESVEIRPPEPESDNKTTRQGTQQGYTDPGPAVIGGDDDLREDLIVERKRQEVRDRVSDGEAPATRPADGNARAVPAHPARHAGGRR